MGHRPPKGKYLNLSKSSTKSSHGGKRAGAGRPRVEDSIRGQTERDIADHAANPTENHDYCTRWQHASESYIEGHAIRVVRQLALFKYKFACNFERNRGTLLSRAAAYRIAHNPDAEQREILKRDYRDALLNAVSFFGPSADLTATGGYTKNITAMVVECTKLLAEKVKRRKPEKSGLHGLTFSPDYKPRA
jgi:hypothetical protein